MVQNKDMALSKKHLDKKFLTFRGGNNLENDFLMRQIKLTGEGIGVLLKKNVSRETMGEIQKQDGSFVSRMDLILEYIANDKIAEAFSLVNSLKYMLSAYDFQNVASWFIKLLRNYQQGFPQKLTVDKIDYYSERLADLL